MRYYIEVLERYATFSGRARRKEYWYFILFHCLIYYGLFFIDEALNLYDVALADHLLSVIYVLITALPSMAVGVRRLHDAGYSGWFLFVPIFSFVLMCMEGNTGTNKYGADPKRLDLSKATEPEDI